jgi:NAD+ diphosphatase
MTLNNNYIRFVPEINLPSGKTEEDIWFVFYKGSIVTRSEGDELGFPRYSEIKSVEGRLENINYLGRLDGVQCFAGELMEDELQGFDFMELRAVFAMIEEELVRAISKGSMLIYWDKNTKHCGRCGSRNKMKHDERAKLCPSCGFVSYPAASSAVIVAITKGDQLLLAHNKNFKNGMYSVVAGFVELGETFEECVKREIFEEVGIEVKNIKYFASQPWPFPNSQMVAFTAEYAGREIQVDNIEIEHAAWFKVNELPQVPGKVSVAGKLIHWFIDNNK